MPHCYNCGKPIQNVLDSDVITFDDLNYSHHDCLYNPERDTMDLIDEHCDAIMLDDNSEGTPEDNSDPYGE